MRAEIISGTLLLSPAPRFRHQRAFGLLVSQPELKLGYGWGATEGGRAWCLVQVAEVHLGIGPDILNPDIAGWRIERAPEVHLYPITAAPDWICEVLSPSTETFDRGTKPPAFAGHGVQHAWLVDPETRRLEVYRRSRAAMREVARFEGDTVVRAEPFDSVELDLAELWG